MKGLAVLGLLAVTALWLAAIWAGKGSADDLSSKLWRTGTLVGVFFLVIIILNVSSSSY